MQVQSCCFAYVNLFLFCRSRCHRHCLSSLKTTTPGTTSPSLYEQCVGSFTSYRIYMCRGRETGPTVYRPYPRRLESLTVCSIFTNEARSAQLFKDSIYWSSRGLNQRHPAWQTGAYPTELTGRRLIHSKSAPLDLLAV